MSKENSWGMHVEHWPQQELRHLPVFAKELLAGGVAGGLSKTCVAPLERVKILFQTGRMQGGIGETLASILRSEGVLGWFRGNGASVLRIVPYAAFHFGAYEHYRKLFARGVYGQDAERHHIPPWLDLLAGSAAGGTAVLMTYPLDLVRTRLAYDTESGARRPARSASPADAASPSGRPAPILVPAVSSVSNSTAAARGSSRAFASLSASSLLLTQSTSEASARAASGQSATSSGRSGHSSAALAPQQCRSTSSAAVAAALRAADATRRQQGSSASVAPLQGSVEPVRGRLAALKTGLRGLSSTVESVPGSAGGEHAARRATIRSVLVDTVRRDGVLGLYRGIGPTLLGIVPYAGLKFYTYQSMKQQYWKLHEPAATVSPEALQQHKLPVTTMLAFGAIAGVVTQTITYPLDVVRRHMQVQGLKKADGRPELAPFRSTWHGLKSIVQQRGFRALYAGLSINYLKVVPSTAIGFTIYDAAKQYLDLPQNL